MAIQTLITLIKRAIIEPEALWQEEHAKDFTLSNYLKSVALPVVLITTLLATVVILIFGYRAPFINMVIYPSLKDALIMFVSSIVLFFISIYIFGWIVAYIASLFGGKLDSTKGTIMLFLISIPSLVGKIFAAIPYIGLIITLVASIYSLVLLYKAPSIFLDLPQENKTKAFILFLLASFVISILLSALFGGLLQPTTTPLPRG